MTGAPYLLAGMSTTDIAAMPKESTVVVQPIGAVEQHGPHLPVVTDALVAEWVAGRAAELAPAGQAAVLPPLSYGKSNEHGGWPGTVTLSAETLLAVCKDVGRSLAATGFTRLVFVNGHGGNPGLLEVAARDIRAETGLLVFVATIPRFGVPAGVDLPAPGFDVHGGHVETSVLLHLAPETVRMDRAAPGGTHLLELFPADGGLALSGALPTAWLSADLTDNGVIGDPRGASPEVGRVIAEHWATRLATAYGRIASFRFR